MDDEKPPENDARYRVMHNDDDLTHNLHILYDSVCREPVPAYLVDLLNKLPR